jgi:hypothetical protein
LISILSKRELVVDSNSFTHGNKLVI